MKLIVVQGTSGGHHVYSLRRRRLIGSGLISVAFLLAIGFLGGIYFRNLNGFGILAPEQLKAWRDTLVEQREEVENIREASTIELDALAILVGRIQGQLLRLNALGERLVTMAELSPDEFNFSEPPALGGPEEGLEEVHSYQMPSFADQIDELAERIDQRTGKLEVLEALLLDRNLQKDVYLAGRPVKKGWLSSPYGRRIDPFTGRRSWHKGIDFAAKEGTEIIAVGSGVVTWSGDRGGYGLMVEINHGNGYTTRYSHNKSNKVKVGDIVSKGQTIALLGSSGRSTGPHVHFEVLVSGRQVDPSSYIKRAGR